MRETEMRSRIIGVSAIIKCLLRTFDQTRLQSRKTSDLLLSAAEGQKVTDMTITTYNNCIQMGIWKRTINMADDDLAANDLGWENHLEIL